MQRICLAVVSGLLASFAGGARAEDTVALREELIAFYEEIAQGEETAGARLNSQLKAARAAGDKPLTLKALRGLVFLNNSDNPRWAGKDQIQQALLLAKELGDEGSFALLDAAYGSWLVQAGDPSGEVHAKTAIEHAQRGGLDVVLPYLNLEYASLLIRMSRSAEGIEPLRQAYKAFSASGNRIGSINVLSQMGQALRAPETASSEDLAQAENYLQQAMQLVDREKERELVWTILAGLVLTAQRQGNLEGALQHLGALRGLMNVGVKTSGLPWVQYRTGAIQVALGRTQDAIDEFRRALPAFEKSNDALLIAFTLLGLAEAYSQQGRMAEARNALALAKKRIMGMGTPRLTVMYHAAAASVAARNEDFKRAYEETLAMAKAQLEVAQASSSRQFEAQKVRFAVARNDAENALLRAREVEANARRTAMTLVLAMTGLALAGAGAFLWREVLQKRRFATLALRDELTGAPNRRSMLEILPRSIEARQPGEGAMIAILDIDHFKRVNDAFGHDVGDEVLRSFYAACLSCLRRTDVLGRWGGEEFLLVGQGNSQADVMTLFRRLLDAVQQVKAQGMPSDYRLTFSMGVSRVEANAGDFAEAIRLADEALYEAKRAGRSRCEFASQVRKVPISA